MYAIRSYYELKDKGLPWEKAKAFDRSAVICNDFIPKTELPGVGNIKFQLKKNGEVVQNGDTSFMLFPIDELISQVSNYFTLKIGDLIYTGTPAGVGPVAIGDRLEGFLEGHKMFDFEVKYRITSYNVCYTKLLRMGFFCGFSPETIICWKTDMRR